MSKREKIREISAIAVFYGFESTFFILYRTAHPVTAAKEHRPNGGAFEPAGARVP